MAVEVFVPVSNADAKFGLRAMTNAAKSTHTNLVFNSNILRRFYLFLAEEKPPPTIFTSTSILVANDDQVESTVKKLIQRVRLLHTAAMVALSPRMSALKFVRQAGCRTRLHYQVIYACWGSAGSGAQEGGRNLPADGQADLIWSRSERRAVKPPLIIA